LFNNFLKDEIEDTMVLKAFDVKIKSVGILFNNQLDKEIFINSVDYGVDGIVKIERILKEAFPDCKI